MTSTAVSPVPSPRRALEEALFALINARAFPCVGAKSSLSTNGLKVMVARDIRSAWDDLKIQEALAAFAADLDGAGLQSFAVLFEGPTDLDEEGFEAALWSRLQSLKDKDNWLSFPQDQRVASDPASPDFAFSIGGEAFFVVGMHPGASRPSRRTPMPAMIFNPFSQFEALRQSGRYKRMSEVVRRRDEGFCGSANPMLDDHGASSAARQFSGRVVGPDWKCPFRAPTASPKLF